MTWVRVIDMSLNLLLTYTHAYFVGNPRKPIASKRSSCYVYLRV